MKTLGFLISHKSGERRRAILPQDLKNVRNVDHIFVEKGYGSTLGISDKEYIDAGVSVLPREEILNCDVLIDVKLGDCDFINTIDDGKILVGWAHSVQKIDFTDAAIAHKHTVIAWENIFEDGRYIFYRNREVAGEAAILQAYQYCGKMPYDTKVAIIGNGQTAKGAMRVLVPLGATVDVFGRKMESTFKKVMFDYDVIVNCVLWDVTRKDHLITYDDLKKFKEGTMIIDVSCDPHMEIESSHPTRIEDPVYTIDGVIHYSVDNTPAMFPFTVSRILSDRFSVYLDCLIEDNYPENITRAVDIDNGKIVNQEIIKYRESIGL